MDLIPEPGLGLYLPLYEPDGISFISRDGCGHLCTVSGAVWKSDGRSFEGNGRITVPNSMVLPSTGSFTLDMWLKIPEPPANLASFHLAGKWDGSADTTFLLQVARNDAISLADFICYIGGLSLSNASRLNYSGYLKNWVDIVITWDGRNNSIYADGMLKGIADVPLAPQAVDNDITIGQRENGTNGLHGFIGAIAIYNRALSLGEIQQNYLKMKQRYQ